MRIFNKKDTQKKATTKLPMGRKSRTGLGERRKICVKENKRHPFSQESEQGKT